MQTYFILCVAVILLYFVADFLSTPSLQEYVDVHRDRLLWAPRARILTEADNGDIILWPTKNKIIKYATGSPFGHISVVFRSAGLSGEESCLYCWEVNRKGPGVFRLEDKLGAAKKKVLGWKPLQRGPRPSSAQVWETVSIFLNRTPDLVPIRWALSRMLAATPCGGGVLNNLLVPNKMVFCSEVVAETLQRSNILKQDPPSTYYSPSDWFNNNLALEDESDYGPTYFFRP